MAQTQATSGVRGGDPQFNDIQHCPRCTRACNREHFSWTRSQPLNQVVTYLYCAECIQGWETLWVFDGLIWKMSTTTLAHDPGRDAEDWHEFMKHLEAARCVAA